MVEIIGKSYSLTTIKIYCRLLGFFPYDLVRKGDMICAKFSIKYGIWSYFLGINMIVLGTTGVISSLLTLRTWVSPTFMNEMMIVYIVHLNLMFNIVYAFCCIVYTTFGRRNLNKFINNIMKVDKKLGQLEISINKNKWSKVVALSIGISISIIVVADSFSYFRIFDRITFFNYVLRKLPYYCSYIFTFGQNFLYYSLVLLVKARLSAIKDAIVSDGISNAYKDGFIFRVKRAGTNDYKDLQNIYMGLFDAVKALDELVRPIIVLTFVTRFFALLITPFILYVQIVGYGNHFFIVSQTLWSLAQCFSLALVVEPSFCCKKEYDKLRQEISRIICQEIILDVNLDMLFDLVKASPIEFYINDSTPLTRTLYVSILGSLTTYLVVLFQIWKH